MNQKHKYCNRLTWESTSGETGEVLSRIVWEQFYDDKEEQVAEMQTLVPAVIGTVQEVTVARADEHMRRRKNG